MWPAPGLPIKIIMGYVQMVYYQSKSVGCFKTPKLEWNRTKVKESVLNEPVPSDSGSFLRSERVGLVLKVLLTCICGCLQLDVPVLLMR